MATTLCGFNDDGHGAGQLLLVAHGPTLMVDIGFDPDFKPNTGSIPKLAMPDVRALVDTGATESCIDSALALSLNLPVIDRRRIAGAGGLHEVNVHLAQIRVPSLEANLVGHFSAVDLSAGGSPHQALIGRTFLQNFVMIYHGTSGTVAIGHEADFARMAAESKRA